MESFIDEMEFCDEDETVEMEGTYTPPTSLPYPTRLVDSGCEIFEEYIIPEAEKKAVLEMLYPFRDVPDLDDVMEDLHARKTFRVREFKVVKWPLMLALMSPYWATSGGSVIDWQRVSK